MGPALKPWERFCGGGASVQPEDGPVLRVEDGLLPEIVFDLRALILGLITGQASDGAAGEQFAPGVVRAGGEALVVPGHPARGAPDGRCTLPVDFLRGNEHVNVRCAYPANHNTKCAWNPEKGTLTVDLPAPICARIFELEY